MDPSPPPRRAPRPPPRQGQPASGRNFAQSSAGGAASTSTLMNGASPPRFRNHASGAVDEEVRKKKEAWGESYVEKEDSIRNDYSTHYVVTGSRPQNHLRGAAVEQRFSEYPKLASLLVQKHLLHSSPHHSISPTYLSLPPPLALPHLSSSRFDVILLTPPPSVSYSELKSLDLSRIAASPGFIWLWVGNGQRDNGGGVGLEKGRELLAEWGYRRCEDIVWLKSNRGGEKEDLENDCETMFTPTIEHCLMGIRGTVRRSNDPWLVHCNVDTDVLVWEGSTADPLLKPPELQSLIENFCLGTRRLHLYGSSRESLRRGWLTVGDVNFGGEGADGLREVEGEGGSEWTATEWEKESYDALWNKAGGIGDGVDSLLPFVEELDNLRPKSPPPRNGQASSGGLGRGRGAGLGITRSGAAQQARLPPASHGRPIHHPPPQQPPPQFSTDFYSPSSQHQQHFDTQMQYIYNSQIQQWIPAGVGRQPHPQPTPYNQLSPDYSLVMPHLGVGMNGFPRTGGGGRQMGYQVPQRGFEGVQFRDFDAFQNGGGGMGSTSAPGHPGVMTAQEPSVC